MLEAKGATKTFYPGTVNETKALDGIDLNVEDGSFVIILGGNGSGKSTLLNAVAGTFPIDAGTIAVGGTDVTRWAEHQRAALIGRVFQNPFSGTAAEMSIAENFSLAAHRGLRRGLSWALSSSLMHELTGRVRELRMGLEERLYTPIGALSGGQRQALTLLMASWLKPKLLLLDEHTAALDPKSADQVIQLTKAIVERDRITTLMVTHSIQQAVRLGDRMIMMHHGRIVHDFRGADKERLKADEVIALFDEIRRRELLDEGAAAFLRDAYV